MSAIHRLIGHIEEHGHYTLGETLPGETFIAAREEMTFALDTVLDERHRQDNKWGEQNHNPYIYLGILVEEVGELAQAILHSQFGGNHAGFSEVRKEAVHCCAVALALVECLDRGTWSPSDVEFPSLFPDLDSSTGE